MYGTKEELEDAEDFYPFVYVPIGHYWLNYKYLGIKYTLKIKKF